MNGKYGNGGAGIIMGKDFPVEVPFRSHDGSPDLTEADTVAPSCSGQYDAVIKIIHSKGGAFKMGL